MMTATDTQDSSNSFLATRAALSSAACASHFGKDGLGWWRDVRRQVDCIGAQDMSDSLAVRLKAWCADNVEVRRGKDMVPLVPSVQTIDEVATLLAGANPRDEVAEYLEGLRGAWDGTPRIQGPLADAMGLAASRPELAMAERAWLYRWAISAVARALAPGCKADAALVLVGGQGLGKSSSVRALFGDAWVHDSAIDMESKDGASVMGKAWGVELAELSSIRRSSDVESVKHFLSLQEDTYRPAYGRRSITVPRRAVVIGTTNDASPLTDATGNRRFWCVRVERPADLEYIKANRDQLWAEALAAYDAGEQWHLTAEEAAAQTAAAEAYTSTDEWVELLRTWAEAVGEGETYKLGQVAQEQMGIEGKHLDRPAQARLASALRLLGFEKRHLRGGKWWVKRPRE